MIEATIDAAIDISIDPCNDVMNDAWIVVSTEAMIEASID